MEKLEPISMSTHCSREYYTYSVDWPLELDLEGKNFLKLYFDKVGAMRSGKQHCKTGPFAGEGKHFEFILKRGQHEDVEVYVKCCHPSIRTESYKIISATLSAIGKDKAEFRIGHFQEVSSDTLQSLDAYCKNPKPDCKNRRPGRETAKVMGLTVKDIQRPHPRNPNFMESLDRSRIRAFSFEMKICREGYDFPKSEICCCD